jgi:hypothetical protein
MLPARTKVGKQTPLARGLVSWYSCLIFRQGQTAGDLCWNPAECSAERLRKIGKRVPRSPVSLRQSPGKQNQPYMVCTHYLTSHSFAFRYRTWGAAANLLGRFRRSAIHKLGLRVGRRIPPARYESACRASWLHQAGRPSSLLASAGVETHAPLSESRCCER